MSEAVATALDHQLDDLAAVAWTLEPVPSYGGGFRGGAVPGVEAA